MPVRKSLPLTLLLLLLAAAPAYAGGLRNTALPKVTGPATAGATLSASKGSWVGRPTKLRFRWLRCTVHCAAIKGATAARYTVVAADVGRRLAVEVTATRSGRSRTARSKLTATVIKAPAVIITPPAAPVATATATPPLLSLGNDIAPIPAAPPRAPAITGAEAGDGAVSLDWSVPDDGGSAITGYRVTPYVDGEAQPSVTLDSAHEYRFPGLINGRAYRFSVAALNALGRSSESALSATVTPWFEIPALPLISRGAPAYTNDDCSDSSPAANADDDAYTTAWMACESAPAADDPKWLAYDLSGVDPTARGKVIVAWLNDPTTGAYDHTVNNTVGYFNAADYTLEASDADGGGQPPRDGWRELARVTANTFASRQQLLDLGQANWLRIVVTRADTSTGNDGVRLNLDVYDASRGSANDWIFFGDSITQDGLLHDTRLDAENAIVAPLGDLIGGLAGVPAPPFQDGGVGGLTSAQGAELVPGWLKLFPGRFVALSYGTNDAFAEGGNPDIGELFRANMARMVEAVLAAGKVPVIPTIPWGATPELQASVPVLNAELAQLRSEYPQIVAGPDLYAYFAAHPDLIRSDDGIHPTWDLGYSAFRRLWAERVAALYR